MVLGVKLQNVGMYLGVNGPVHEHWSSDLFACKLTINKTQNSAGDVKFLKSYSLKNKYGLYETTNARKGEISTDQ